MKENLDKSIQQHQKTLDDGLKALGILLEGNTDTTRSLLKRAAQFYKHRQNGNSWGAFIEAVQMLASVIWFAIRNPITTYHLVKLGSLASEPEVQVELLKSDALHNFLKDGKNRGAFEDFTLLLKELDPETCNMLKALMAASFDVLGEKERYDQFIGLAKDVLVNGNRDYMKIAASVMGLLNQSEKMQVFFQQHNKQLAAVFQSFLKDADGDGKSTPLAETLANFGISEKLLEHSAAFIKNPEKIKDILIELNEEPLFKWAKTALHIVNQDKALCEFIEQNPGEITGIASALSKQIPSIEEAMKKFNCDPKILEAITPALREPKKAEEVLNALNNGQFKEMVTGALDLMSSRDNKAAQEFQDYFKDNIGYFPPLVARILSMPNGSEAMQTLQYSLAEQQHREVMEQLKKAADNSKSGAKISIAWIEQNQNLLVPLISHIARRYQYQADNKEMLTEKGLTDDIVQSDVGFLESLRAVPYQSAIHQWNKQTEALSKSKVLSHALTRAIKREDQDPPKAEKSFIKRVKNLLEDNPDLKKSLGAYDKALEDKLSELASPIAPILTELGPDSSRIEELSKALKSFDPQDPAIALNLITKGLEYLGGNAGLKQLLRDNVPNFVKAVKNFSKDIPIISAIFKERIELEPILEDFFASPASFKILMESVRPILTAMNKSDYTAMLESAADLLENIEKDPDLKAFLAKHQDAFQDLFTLVAEQTPAMQNLQKLIDFNTIIKTLADNPASLAPILRKATETLATYHNPDISTIQKVTGVAKGVVSVLYQTLSNPSVIATATGSAHKIFTGGDRTATISQEDVPLMLEVLGREPKEPDAPKPNLRDTITKVFKEQKLLDKYPARSLRTINFDQQAIEGIEINNFAIDNLSLAEGSFENVTFKDIALANAKFQKVRLTNLEFQNVSTPKEAGVTFFHSQFDSVSFRNTSLNNSQFDSVKFQNVSFSGSVLTNTKFSGNTEFVGVSFEGATVDDVSLESLLEAYADHKLYEGVGKAPKVDLKLTKVNLAGDCTALNFRGLDFSGANLQQVTSLQQANLAGVNLSNATVAPDLLKEAEGLELAQLDGIKDLQGEPIDVDKLLKARQEALVTILSKMMRQEADRKNQANAAYPVIKDEEAAAQHMNVALDKLPAYMKAYVINAIERNQSALKAGTAYFSTDDVKDAIDLRFDKLPTLAALSEAYLAGAVENNPSKYIKGTVIAEMVSDQINNKLFGIGTDRGKDALNIRLHLQRTLYQNPELTDHLTSLMIQNKENPQGYSMDPKQESLLEKLYAEYHKHSKYTTAGLATGSIYMPHTALNGEAGKKVQTAIADIIKYDQKLAQDLSPDEIKLAGNIADKLAEQLFGAGKEANRRADKQKITLHIENILTQLKKDKFDIADLKQDNILEAMVGKLTFSYTGALSSGTGLAALYYHNATQYTKTGLLSGGVQLKEDSKLPPDFMEKIIQQIQGPLKSMAASKEETKKLEGHAIQEATQSNSHHPTFSKYSFTERLGDEKRRHQISRGS